MLERGLLGRGHWLLIAVDAGVPWDFVLGTVEHLAEWQLIAYTQTPNSTSSFRPVANVGVGSIVPMFVEQSQELEETLRSGGLHHLVTIGVDTILVLAGVVASSCCIYTVHLKNTTIAPLPFHHRSRVCTLKNSDIANLSKRENMRDTRYE